MIRRLVGSVVLAAMLGCDGTNPVLILPAGSWGGEGAEMVVSATGVTFDYNCAGGATSVPPVVDDDGTFSWEGTYTFVVPAGGPPEAPHGATYRGTLTGATIVVGVSLHDFDIYIPPVTVVSGQAPVIARCP